MNRQLAQRCGTTRATTELSDNPILQRVRSAHEVGNFANAALQKLTQSFHLLMGKRRQICEAGVVVEPSICMVHEFNAAEFQIDAGVHDLPLDEFVRWDLSQCLKHVVACIAKILVVHRVRVPGEGCVCRLDELKGCNSAQSKSGRNPSAGVHLRHSPRDVYGGEADRDCYQDLSPGRPFAGRQAGPLKKDWAVTAWLSHVGAPLRGSVSIGVTVQRVNC